MHSVACNSLRTKFGTLIEQKILYQMTSKPLQSDIVFKVKAEVKLRLVGDFEFDLQSNV